MTEAERWWKGTKWREMKVHKYPHPTGGEFKRYLIQVVRTRNRGVNTLFKDTKVIRN